MRKLVLILACMLTSMPFWAEEQRDWAGFSRYAQENDSLLKAGTEVKVVFLGNSITQGWRDMRPQFFLEHGFIGRGISGQTSSEMLVRMRADVLDLHPQIVVILAGTNDIARNNGYISHKHILGNIRSMCELSRANGIQPVLCSLVPARAFYWNPQVMGAAGQIKTMNALIRAYADANAIPYVDYWSPMAAADGGLREGLSYDGVHPNDKGYAIMEPIILNALKQLAK